MKIVLDTNVWISSLLLPKSIPGKIVVAWQHALFKIVTSDYILDEIRKVLNYPKIRDRINISAEGIDEYISLIRFFADVVDLASINPKKIKNLRDANDSPILLTLLASNADYLVTGDHDLLVLNKEYPVLTPSEFAEFLD